MDVKKVVYPNGETLFYDNWNNFLNNESHNFYFITDTNIAQYYPELLSTFPHTVLMAGENYKNIDAVNYLYSRLCEKKIDKTFTLVGFGGGVVTDLVGFVAATYLRGINYVAVPTSLLGMVDAAIGGKNGINFENYKNTIGTICHPKAIIIDEYFLSTLPKKELENGFAEIIKHSCIKDSELFNKLINNNLEYFINNKNEFKNLIWRNIDIKNSVVIKDPLEKHERKFLNFGHTYGHAIEKEYNLMHGHAISIGMVKATELSIKYNSLESSELDKIKSCLIQYNLPVENKNIKWNNLTNNLFMDKKRKGNSIDFVLLNRIGDATIKPININEL